MKIYSPSRTEAYDFCSLKGDLMYRQHYQRREADNGTVGKIVGAAFARGTEDIHRGVGPGLNPALTLFDRSVRHYVDHGVSFSQDLETVRVDLAKSLARYEKENPFATWQIKEVEFELSEYGNCRLDVFGIDNVGRSSIADIKYKRTLNADYLLKTVNDYRDSWQFQHYPWAFNDWLAQSAVKEVYQPVTHMYLTLVIAKPFKVLMYPFAVNEVYQKRWLAGAQQKWADIAAYERGDKQPCVSTNHRDQYGYCPMLRACLDLDCDPDLMQHEYTQVPRLPDEGGT